MGDKGFYCNLPSAICNLLFEFEDFAVFVRDFDGKRVALFSRQKLLFAGLDVDAGNLSF